ncbi:MAG: SMI1/KNR4 family protein [Methanoregula sp.]|nr:SMI1/KNR4 family protein [Methanoregula sp.]
MKLPDDFKQCAIENSGGSPDPCRFDAENEKGIRLEKLFSLDPKSDHFFRFYYEHIRIWAPGLYPIAADSRQNFICLDYREHFPPVITYLKHDVTGKGNHQFIFVCNSFTELLEMLY